MHGCAPIARDSARSWGFTFDGISLSPNIFLMCGCLGGLKIALAFFLSAFAAVAVWAFRPFFLGRSSAKQQGTGEKRAAKRPLVVALDRAFKGSLLVLVAFGLPFVMVLREGIAQGNRGTAEARQAIKLRRIVRIAGLKETGVPSEYIYLRDFGSVLVVAETVPNKPDLAGIRFIPRESYSTLLLCPVAEKPAAPVQPTPPAPAKTP